VASRVKYEVARLFCLWNESSKTRAEIARELGVTAGQLTKLASRHGLGPRGRQHRAFSMDDPTPEQIEERAAECRARHYAQRLAETPDASLNKASARRRRDVVR
jgi:hypothetical protein